MNENDRNPAIRIHIDQQVFIDAILGAEEIEDATVLTEVVGFDRTETNYVLEGALAFTGYVQNQEQTQREVTAEDLLGDIVSSVEEEDITVQQIHCRMPFTLEVPITAQRTEFINVTARVGTWNLHVLGPKWVHVRSELIVSGLSGTDGYRFRCGTQEEGFAERQQDTVAGEYSSAMFGDSQNAPQQPFSETQLNTQPLFPQFPGGSNYYEQTTPYISPFAAPSHPLTWDRNWPQPFVNNKDQVDAQNDAAYESVQDESPYKEPSFNEALMRNESTYSNVTEDQDQQVWNDAEAADAIEAVGRNEENFTNEEFTSVEAEAAQQQDVEEQELFYARSTEISEDENASETEAQLESVAETGTVDASLSSEENLLQIEHETSFHFEEIAESSASQNELEFKLKIGSKNNQESSTFQAMSKLMEAGTTRDDDKHSPSGVFDVTGLESSPSSPSSPSGPSASVSGTKVSPSIKAPSPSKTEVEIGEAVPVNAIITPIETNPIIPNPVSFDGFAEPVQVQHVPIEPALVTDGLIQQNSLIEKEVESKTVVDISITESPQASVTIGDDKKYKQDEGRVYLWTELYPYLEESFRPMKFRIVQEDDTLESIAENYRIPLSEVTRVNRLQSEHIDVGQLLYIPVR